MPIKMVCNWCGKEYKLPPSRAFMETKSGMRFCGRKCHSEWRTKYFVQTDHMKQALSKWVKGEGNPQWKGDDAKDAAGRKRARQIYKELLPCEVCGNTRTERHHKDGNTKNNDPSNISFLCRRHHIEADRKRGNHGWFVSKLKGAFCESNT